MDKIYCEYCEKNINKKNSYGHIWSDNHEWCVDRYLIKNKKYICLLNKCINYEDFYESKLLETLYIKNNNDSSRCIKIDYLASYIDSLMIKNSVNKGPIKSINICVYDWCCIRNNGIMIFKDEYKCHNLSYGGDYYFYLTPISRTKNGFFTWNHYDNENDQYYNPYRELTYPKFKYLHHKDIDNYIIEFVDNS